MTTSSLQISNGTGASVRAAINAAFSALVTQSLSATEPSPTYPMQPWGDSSTGELKYRNASNTAWITVGRFTGTSLRFGAAPVSVKHYGAVGDGYTDDTAAIQDALDDLVSKGGGSLDLEDGNYMISTFGKPGSGAAMLLNFTSENTLPVALIGHGASIIHDCDPSAITLMVNGQPAGSPPYSQAAYRIRDFTVRGVTFTGTRTPSDTDIEATQGNTLLYLSYVENARIVNNHFTNCNGSGIYFFARNTAISGNTFVNANGGVQGSDSQFVVIQGNTFSCPFKSDDQIAVFASASGATHNVLIEGNQIDKGYDGLKGIGGSRRGWASGIKLGDYIENVIIDDNVIANNNSVNSTDRNSSTTALGGILIENNVAGVKNLTITNNVITNCRNGMFAYYGIENLVVTGNTISDCEEWPMIFSSTSTTTRSSGTVIDGNVVDNCGNASYSGGSAIRVFSADVVKITGNVIRDCNFLYPISVGMAGGSSDRANDIDVSHNTIYSSSVPTEAASAVVAYFNRCTNIRFNGNKINYRSLYSAQFYACGTTGYLSSSDNVLEDFTSGGNAIVFTTDSIPVLSTGNYERPNGANWEGRHLGRKRPDNLNNQSRSIVEQEYTAAPTTLTWIIGDRVIYKSIADGTNPTGAICVGGGSPGSWRGYGSAV